MVIAFVLIQCNNQSVEWVIEELKKVESVIEIQGVFGMYDIIIKVQTNDSDTINKIILTQIRKIEKVKTTLTLLLIDSDKYDYSRISS
jgi:DNA-binding Lrp family transcriptional regulator